MSVKRNDIAAAERQAAALRLRASGATYEQIGAALGVSKPTAFRAVKGALDGTVAEAANDLRLIECARLDQLLLAVWPQAVRGNLRAVDRVLAISKRRAALLGLDAPRPVAVSGQLVMKGFSEKVAAEYGLDAAEILAEAERLLRGSDADD